jgi:hypothetical protein
VGTHERREQLILHGAWLDMARPTHDYGGAVAAFPVTLLTVERRDAAVGEGDRLGAIVGGEDDDGIVELPMLSSFFSTSPMLSSSASCRLR